jgi:hypothetical protein
MRHSDWKMHTRSQSIEPVTSTCICPSWLVRRIVPELSTTDKGSTYLKMIACARLRAAS